MVLKKAEAQRSSCKLIAHHSPQSSIAEQYRGLRANINFLSSHENPLRSIVITSASPSEGKSTTAANLAIVFAQEGKRVLLVDGDLRNPTMHLAFLDHHSKGLSDYLEKRMLIDKIIQSTEIENLDLLPGGSVSANPSELLSSELMQKLFDQLYKVYDLILVDVPPILSVSDSKVLANKCDGAILVIKSGDTDRSLAIRAKEEIVLSNSKLIGVVLTNCSMS